MDADYAHHRGLVRFLVAEGKHFGGKHIGKALETAKRFTGWSRRALRRLGSPIRAALKTPPLPRY